MAKEKFQLTALDALQALVTHVHELEFDCFKEFVEEGNNPSGHAYPNADMLYNVMDRLVPLLEGVKVEMEYDLEDKELKPTITK